MAIINFILLGFWVGMLLLPNLTVIAFANAWEIDVRAIFAVSVWVILCMYSLMPRRWFLVATYPIMLAGIVVLGADLYRSVNVFDLLAVFYTFKSTEVIDAVRPYIGMISIMSLVLLVPLGLLWRGDIPRPSHRIQLTVILAGLALAVSLPNHVWLNAWPIALVPAALAAQSSGVGIELPPTANIRMSPRDRYQSWKASREEKPSDAETYVLIIGESVRSDRINGCGGRAQITAPPAGSLVYCDVLSGASSTHASVPLLVSRELPGHMDRVSHDTTFLNAFEAAGFETFWLSVTERSMAWPDP